MKNILIIKCDENHPKINSQYGNNEDWIIKNSGINSDYFRITNLPEGDLLRHPDDYSAAVITNSQFHINQRLPWIGQLKNWLLTARYSNTPVLGIGFGLHAIVEACGGKISKNTNGHVLGTAFINVKSNFLSDPIFANVGASFESYLNYTRKISTTPPSSDVLATTMTGDIMAIRINNLYGIQFSPEIPEKVFKSYIINSKLPTKARLGVKLSSEHKNYSIIPNFFTSFQIY